MESITLLFVSGLLLVALYLTLMVRKDIALKNEVERERQRQRPRRAGGR
jgi:hypothetical protein